MSLPRNNLDEVRRKKTEPLPLSPAPGLLAKKFTFKPSLSLPRTVSDVAARKALPSFRSPGFKPQPVPSSSTSRKREIVDLSVSLDDADDSQVPIKRASSDSSITSGGSPSSKRAKQEYLSNKENVSPKTPKDKGKAKATSPRLDRRSPCRQREDPEDDRPWLKLPLPNPNPFDALNEDFPLPDPIPSAKKSTCTSTVSSPFPTALDVHRGREVTPSEPPMSGGHTSCFPDLLDRTTLTLTQLLRFDYAQLHKIDDAQLESYTKGTTADTHLLDLLRIQIDNRIKAIQQLITDREKSERSSPAPIMHVGMKSVALDTPTRSRSAASSITLVPLSVPAANVSTLQCEDKVYFAPAPVSVDASIQQSTVASSSSLYHGADPPESPTSIVYAKPSPRKAKYGSADLNDLPAPQSDSAIDAIWDTVEDIDEGDLAEIDLVSDLPAKQAITRPGQPIGEPRKPRVDQTSSPYYMEAMRVLKEDFGFHKFRKNQLEAINATLSGQDVFVLMPTGGGKSLCFQCPAVCRGGKTCGLTVVVSPLIALMRDQVKSLEEKGIDVALWNSEKTGDDVVDIRERLLADKKPAMIYVTPEKLKESYALKNVLARLYREGELARFVVDEAHCISSWGRDFRDAYSTLGNLRDEYPDIPIMALTATAKTNVVDDIIHRLKMRSPVVLKESFNRANLHYDVRPKVRNVLNEIAAFIKSRYPGKCGIIYALSRNSCEEIAKDLREKHGLSAKHYHAKMSPEDKNATQAAWKRGQCNIIVATIAFGMGIDKPDVRFVIHYTMPKSLDGYYQETGRAGRDGEASECVLYYSYADVAGLIKMIGSKDGPKISPEEEKRQREDIYAVVSYCQDSTTCRRVQVLRYFGETFQPEDCHRSCNNCTHEGSLMEEDFTQAAHDAVKLTKEILLSAGKNTTQNYCQEVFLGMNHKEIRSRGHSDLALHGRGRGWPKETVERLFSKLLEMSVFRHVSLANGCGYHNLYLELGPSVEDFLASKRTVLLPVRQQLPGSVVPRKGKHLDRAKPISTFRSKKAATRVEDEDPITFYEDGADVSFGNPVNKDPIEPRTSKYIAAPLPAQWPPNRGTSKKHGGEDEVRQDGYSSLYERLKSACYAKCKNADREDFLPDSTIQMLTLRQPTDPYAFRDVLREDNEDRITDPTELAAFVEKRDAQLREVVLTLIMKYGVAKAQRTNTRTATSFNAATMRKSYAFKPNQS